MKYRMVFVAAGAAIGLFYLAAGVVLLQWAGIGPLAVQTWAALTALGALVNVIVAVTWSGDDESGLPASRLLLMQTYLPLTMVAAGLVFFCAPFVFVAVWLVNFLCLAPARLAHAALIQRRTHARMKESGRLISWDSLEPRLARGEGVLVVDATECQPGVVWWTEDDLLADPGLLVLADERFRRITHEQLDKGVESLLPLSKFVARFLAGVTGRALLTPLRANFVESRKFLRAYPRAAVFAVDAHSGRVPSWSRVKR